MAKFSMGDVDKPGRSKDSLDPKSRKRTQVSVSTWLSEMPDGVIEEYITRAERKGDVSYNAKQLCDFMRSDGRSNEVKEEFVDQINRLFSDYRRSETFSGDLEADVSRLYDLMISDDISPDQRQLLVDHINFLFCDERLSETLTGDLHDDVKHLYQRMKERDTAFAGRTWIADGVNDEFVGEGHSQLSDDRKFVLKNQRAAEQWLIQTIEARYQNQPNQVRLFLKDIADEISAHHLHAIEGYAFSLEQQTEDEAKQWLVKMIDEKYPHQSRKEPQLHQFLGALNNRMNQASEQGGRYPHAIHGSHFSLDDQEAASTWLANAIKTVYKGQPDPFGAFLHTRPLLLIAANSSEHQAAYKCLAREDRHWAACFVKGILKSATIRDSVRRPARYYKNHSGMYDFSDLVGGAWGKFGPIEMKVLEGKEREGAIERIVNDTRDDWIYSKTRGNLPEREKIGEIQQCAIALGRLAFGVQLAYARVLRDRKSNDQEQLTESKQAYVKAYDALTQGIYDLQREKKSSLKNVPVADVEKQKIKQDVAQTVKEVQKLVHTELQALAKEMAHKGSPSETSHRGDWRNLIRGGDGKGRRIQ